jgi:DedD protein
MARSRTPLTDEQGALDPARPQKNRARRRLIGAAALCVLAAVVLPLVLDSEPHRASEEVQVLIPSRDTPLPSDPDPQAAVAPAAPSVSGRISQDAGAVSRAPDPVVPPAVPPAEPEASNPGVSSTGVSSTGVSNPGATAAAQAAAASAATAAEPVGSAPAVSGTDAKPPVASAQAAHEGAAKPEPSKSDAAKPEAEKPESAKHETAKADAAKSQSGRTGSDAKGAAADAHPPKSADAASSQRYVLQVGAFASERVAGAQLQRLKTAGLAAYTERIQTAGGERIRVRAGPFATKEAAESARRRLKSNGIDTVLITR